MRNVKRHIPPIAFLMLGGIGAAGCASPSYNVQLSLDRDYASSLGDERVFIHLIPLTEQNRLSLESMPVDSYWQYGPTTRRAPIDRPQSTRMFELSADAPDATLSKQDGVWQAWRDAGARDLLILSSRPDPPSDTGGADDPRRRLIPVAARGWKATDYRILVSARGLEISRLNSNESAQVSSSRPSP